MRIEQSKNKDNDLMCATPINITSSEDETAPKDTVIIHSSSNITPY